MSKKHDFISRKQAERRSKGKKFIDEAQVDGTNFGLTPGEVTEAVGKWGTFDAEMTNSTNAKAALQSQTQTTTAADEAFVEVERRLAGKMKKSSNYNPAVGERYKIIGDEMTMDIQNAKPVVKTSKAPTGWKFEFNLLDFFDGVKIFRKRPDQANFTYLATDTSSPYIDTDPQVDGTQYYAFFMISDEMVGKVSDTITVTVSGN